MSEANIIHSRYGLRCEKLDKPLNLGWGFTSNSIVKWVKMSLWIRFWNNTTRSSLA